MDWLKINPCDYSLCSPRLHSLTFSRSGPTHLCVTSWEGESSQQTSIQDLEIDEVSVVREYFSMFGNILKEIP